MISIENLATSPGVEKKLFGQLDGFFKNTGNANLICIYDNSCYLVSSDGIRQKLFCFRNKFGLVIQFYRSVFKETLRLKPDLLYIRYPFFEPFFLNLLRKTKKLGVKNVIEFPTFPYDGEYKAKSLIKRLALLVDFFFRQFSHSNVHLATTYTEVSNILGISTIKLTNGVNLEKIVPRETPTNRSSNEFNIVAVANLSRTQAFDRVLFGIEQFIKKNTTKVKPIFKIVGSGEQLDKLKELTEQLNIGQHVQFFGFQTGKELDLILCDSHVAIGTLGFHRLGIQSGSSLKNRDYCARGIPFVISSTDDDFPKSVNFVYRVPSDESPINIQNLISFYSGLQDQNYVEEMRNYAQEHLSWEVKLKLILGKF